MRKSMSLLLLVLVSFTSCFTPKEIREAANRTLLSVAKGAKDREQAFDRLVESLVAKHVQVVRQLGREVWQRKRAELHHRIDKKADAKRSELSLYVRTELDAALGPKVAKLSASLDDAKARFRAGLGGEDAKNELALQMASLLAVSQKSVFDLDRHIDEALKKVREDTAKLIDRSMPDDPVVPDTGAGAKQIMASLASNRDAYLASMDAAVAELQRFVFLESRVALVMQGAGLGSFGDKLMSKLESFSSEQIEKVRVKAEKVANRVDAKYTDGVRQAFDSIGKQGGKR